MVMRFKLLDRIIDLKPGASITAVKGLVLAEDYLADHFPQFPVMPGVFMLEAMTQASAWLIRVSEDFQHSMVVLARSAKCEIRRFRRPRPNADRHGRNTQPKRTGNKTESAGHG